MISRRSLFKRAAVVLAALTMAPAVKADAVEMVPLRVDPIVEPLIRTADLPVLARYYGITPSPMLSMPVETLAYFGTAADIPTGWRPAPEWMGVITELGRPERLLGVEDTMAWSDMEGTGVLR